MLTSWKSRAAAVALVVGLIVCAVMWCTDQGVGPASPGATAADASTPRPRRRPSSPAPDAPQVAAASRAVRVVDAETGAPIESARVDVVAAGGTAPATVVSEGRGAFVVSGRPGEVVELVASESEHEETRAAVALVQGDGARIELVRLGSLVVGVAAADSGAPVRGATVSVAPLAAGDARWTGPVAPRTGTGVRTGVTADDGTVRLDRVARSGELDVRVEAEGYAPTNAPVSGRTPRVGIVLARSVEVSVRVTDVTGRPVSGAQVQSWNERGRAVDSRATGDDGRARLAGSSVRDGPGAVRLTVTAAGRGGAAVSAAWPAAGHDVTVTLPDPAPCGVVITDGRGPVAGCAVVFRAVLPFRTGTEAAPFDEVATTGDDGRAAVNAMAGAYYAVTVADGLRQSEVPLLSATELSGFPAVRLGRTRRVELVAASESGRPVAGAVVAVTRHDTGLGVLSRTMSWAAPPAASSVGTTGADGALRFDVAEGAAVRLVVRREGFAAALTEVPPEAVEAKVTLLPAEAVIVEVRDQFGEAMPGVEVTMGWTDPTFGSGTDLFSESSRAITGPGGDAAFRVPLERTVFVSAVGAAAACAQRVVSKDDLFAGRTHVLVLRTREVPMVVTDDTGAPVRDAVIAAHVVGQVPAPGGPLSTDHEGVVRVAVPLPWDENGRPAWTVLRVIGYGEFASSAELDVKDVRDGMTVRLSRQARSALSFVLRAPAGASIRTGLPYAVVDRRRKAPLTGGVAQCERTESVTVPGDAECDLVVSPADAVPQVFSLSSGTAVQEIPLFPQRQVEIVNESATAEIVRLTQKTPFACHWQSQLLAPRARVTVALNDAGNYSLDRLFLSAGDPARRAGFLGKDCRRVLLNRAGIQLE